MKKLLLGYDGSKAAEEAARVAAQVAKQLGAKVIVLTVGQFVSAVGTTVMPTVEENAFLPTAEDGAERVRSFGVEAESEVAFGGPAQMLADLAARERCDLIVVGHRGHGGIKSLLLGSVTKTVATEAPCPVLVVRGKAPATIKSVLVAVDASEHSRHALEAALELANAFAARVTLVHVVFPPLLAEAKLDPVARRMRPIPEQQAGQEALDMGREICARRGVACESVQLGVGSDSVPADGPPGEVIARFAQAGAYDLVAVGRHGKTGLARLMLGSVSDTLLGKAGPLVLVSGERISPS